MNDDGFSQKTVTETDLTIFQKQPSALNTETATTNDTKEVRQAVININEKFNQFDQIIQQQLVESNKQLEAKLREALDAVTTAEAEKKKLREEAEATAVAAETEKKKLEKKLKQRIYELE